MKRYGLPDIHRKTERQKDRKAERQKDRKTERQKDKKTERLKDKRRQRDRGTKRQNKNHCYYFRISFATNMCTNCIK